MKFNNSEHQSPFQNVTLKRNKDAFRMSASMFSTAQATNKMNQGNENVFKMDNRETLNPKQQYQRKSERKSYSKIKLFRPQIPKLQQTPIFKNLSNLINQQKQINRNSTSFLQNRTHCYTSNGTLGQEYNPKYQITNEQHFPPRAVKQVYDISLTKSADGKVNYHFGNLQKSGYLYFCVQRTLMLLNSLYYVSSQQKEDIIMIDIPEHALSVKQLIVADFDVEDIERHPFGQKQIILLVWFQWSVGFYSLEPRGLVKLVDLDMRFETSCEAAFLFDYCKNGNLYYMNQGGEMGKIQLFHQNFLNFWSWSRKFSMRQYFYKLKNQTKRKHQKLLYTGFFQRLKQLYLDIKYWWSTKKTKGLSITCDRELDLLYTLVQTSVKQNIGLNRTKTYNHRQIRMYRLIGKHTKLNILQRIQSEVYMNPPKLLKQLTEQNLYSEIGAHLFNNITLQKFQISGIHVPYSFTNSHFEYGRHRSNLLVLLRNGSRIYLYLSSDKLILNQMINLPNLDTLISLQRRNINPNKNYEPVTVAQRQPANFLLVRHKLNFKDKSLAIIGIYRRTLITLLFSQTQEQNSNAVEQVQILWETSLQQDAQGTPTKNMFFSPSDYRLMLGPQFQNNLYKRKLGQYKYHQIQIINKIAQDDHQKFQSKTEQIRNNTIKQSPLSRQILHYPQQYLFINQDKVRGVTKLRPIDILLAALQKQISSHTEASINSLMFSDFQLGTLIRKIESNLKINDIKTQRLQILAMFVQIYCDVDGVYYFDQLSFDSFGKRQSISNDQRKSINLNNEDQRKRSSQKLSNNFQNSTNDLDNDRESYHERIKRYTQRFNKITSFRKYRHSDLINMQNVTGTRRFDASPLKQDRSDHSVMKLILKLAAFMMKSANAQKTRQYYDQLSKQNEWIPASTRAPSNFIATPQIQQATLIYISRLFVPVWGLKIKSIQSMIFPYLAEICKKIIQFIKRLQYELTMVSLSSSFQQLHDLCARTIEYNLMLSVLSNPPALKYGEGMGAGRQIFQQAIFYSLQKEKNVSKCVNQWRQLLPNYFNLNLLKTITLQAQISNINKADQKKQAILNNYKFMPHYLLYCYYRDGTLTKSQIQSLIELNQNRKGQSSLKNVNHLVNADSMDPLSKVKYAVSEIYKNTNNLEQKLFLIVYAKQNVNNIRNQRESQVQNIKKQVSRLEKVLKIQQLILKQLQRYEDQNPDEKIDDKTKKLINNYLLTPTQIKKLIAQLKKPIIQLIYYCCFWDIDIDVEKTLRELIFDSCKRPRKSSQIRQILKDVFQMTSVTNVNKPPLTPLLRVLDQLAFAQINKTNLQDIISRNEEQFMKEKLWVPLFLAQWGWNRSMILDYYIEQSQKYFKYFQPLGTQQSFLYSWLSAYVLTKFKHMEGRRIFQVANQSILKLGQVQRNKDLENQIKLLIDFIRQNLAY